MSVIDTLITDRTQADVDALLALLAAGTNPAANHKGAYNASDLNRVGAAVNYLAGRLEAVGISVRAEARTDWTAADIPRQSDMEAYLGAAAGIRDKVRAYRPDARLPSSMARLDYAGANAIEDLLEETELAVQRIMLSYRGYAGRQRSGVNCLP